MDTLSKKSIKVSRGFTYTYYTSPAKPGRPTLLLCHGWPDEAALWADLVTSHLVPHGYGVIAADCLGYAGTSKPTDSEAYTMYNMVADQIDILDAKGIQRCVSVGHDWGSVLAQRIYLFRPERVEAICLMNVAYRPPAEKPGDLEEMRAVLEITIGYFPAWYWYLFLSPEGAKVLDDHLESLFDACSGGGQRLKDLFCTKDGLKTFYWRTNRPKLPRPLCWYKSASVNFEVEKQIPKDRYVVNMPLLFVGGSEDPVGLTAAIHAVQQQGLVPQLTVRELEAAHWIMLEKPAELGHTVLDWLDQVYGGEKES